MVISYLHDSLSDAAIRHLDMNKTADGRRNIGDMTFCLSTAMFYTPPHQQEGDMTVVGIPAAMGGTAVNLFRYAIVSRLQDDLDISAALTVIAIDSLLADQCRHTGRRYLLEIETVGDTLPGLEMVDDGLSHFSLIQTC